MGLVGGERRWGAVGVFFKQKTAYEMRISDWRSDVCSSDLFGMQARSGALSDDVFPRNTSRSGCARLLCRKECPQRPASCANAEIGYRAGEDIEPRQTI